MKGILTFVSLVGFVQASSWKWKDFKVTHDKLYASESEEQLRWEIFQLNVDIMSKHNKRYEAGEETFLMGINQFTDLLPEEFASLMLSGLNTTEDVEDEEDLLYIPPANLELPSSVDWRQSGAVTGVKNQGKCGSCWAFAAVGTLEGQQYRKTKYLVELSEQNLLDCSRANHGCNGGLASLALKYIQRNHGIDTAKSYRYKAKKRRCRYNRSHIGARVRRIVHTRRGSESDLAAAVAEKGPIAVSLDATHLHHYSGGVLNKKCHKRSNHAVTLVGYGRDGRNGDYWLVKNSWGTHFGEHGYFRIARNHGNLCHIAGRPVYPIV